MAKNKTLVQAKEWANTCENGCCYESGFEHFIDGVLVLDSPDNEIAGIHAALTFAGFDVDILETEYSEEADDVFDDYYMEGFDDDGWDYDGEEDDWEEDDEFLAEVERRLENPEIVLTIQPNEDGTFTAIDHEIEESKTFGTLSEAMRWGLDDEDESND